MLLIIPDISHLFYQPLSLNIKKMKPHRLKKSCAFLHVSTLFLPDFSFNHSQKPVIMIEYV